MSRLTEAGRLLLSAEKLTNAKLWGFEESISRFAVDSFQDPSERGFSWFLFKDGSAIYADLSVIEERTRAQFENAKKSHFKRNGGGGFLSLESRLADAREAAAKKRARAPKATIADKIAAKSWDRIPGLVDASAVDAFGSERPERGWALFADDSVLVQDEDGTPWTSYTKSDFYEAKRISEDE